VRGWLGALAGAALMSGDLHVLLRDGTVLCRAANALAPGLVKANLLKPAATKFQALETIAAFLGAARDLGVAEHELFTSKQLYDGDAMDAVMRTVVALARVSTRRADYNGPRFSMSAAPPAAAAVEQQRSSVLSARNSAAPRASLGKQTPEAYSHGVGAYSENYEPTTARTADR
jgi:hypothetical protein